MDTQKFFHCEIQQQCARTWRHKQDRLDCQEKNDTVPARRLAKN